MEWSGVATNAESEKEVTSSNVFTNSEGSIGGCDEKRTISSVEEDNLDADPE